MIEKYLLKSKLELEISKIFVFEEPLMVKTQHNREEILYHPQKSQSLTICFVSH